jgi:hypothetical protein
MKTIQTANGSYMRVKDKDAEQMVDGTGRWLKGDYYYASKSDWKKWKERNK